MYVEHPYKFNDKFYAKVDGKFYEITREVAKAMLSAYRNEVYRSKKWQPEDPETMTRKTKWTELLDCVFSENTDGIGVQDLPDRLKSENGTLNFFMIFVFRNKIKTDRKRVKIWQKKDVIR